MFHTSQVVQNFFHQQYLAKSLFLAGVVERELWITTPLLERIIHHWYTLVHFCVLISGDTLFSPTSLCLDVFFEELNSKFHSPGNTDGGWKPLEMRFLTQKGKVFVSLSNHFSGALVLVRVFLHGDSEKTGCHFNPQITGCFWKILQSYFSVVGLHVVVFFWRWPFFHIRSFNIQHSLEKV